MYRKVKSLKSFTIHDLPKSERPRERLNKLGPEALSAQELLTLILGRGVRGESVSMTAQKLLSHFGSLEGIMNASLEDLQSVKGMGLAKASQLKACFEVARRVFTKNEIAEEDKQRELSSAKEIYNLAKSKITSYMKEHLIVLSFDSRNRFLGMDTVSVGTLNANLIHPRETFDAAIRRHADHIVVAHNHPSGNPEPSEDDLEITKRLVEAGKILGIEITDHIIITKNRFFSFKEKEFI
jgi:DNA repair protein RadC